MRVLVLSNIYPPLVIGGYELACANVARGLAERGHDVRVLTSWTPVARIEEDPVPVERSLEAHLHVPFPSAQPAVNRMDVHLGFCSSAGNAIRLLEAIRGFRPDVVYVCNLPGIGGVGLLDTLNEARVPWVHHMMDNVPGALLAGVRPETLELFNAGGRGLFSGGRVIAISRTILDEARASSGLALDEGVDIVPGWADLCAARPHQPYLRGGVARFVAAGAIYAHKGVDLMIEASARLRAEGLPFVVDVFGDGELSKYREMASRFGVADIVRLRGPRAQPELIGLFADYDSFLFPSWDREPFGLVPVEAAGCGTPPVITRNVGAAEWLVDNVHAIKIDRGVDDLADAMRRVARGEVDLARLARAGRRLVARDLSFARCLDRIEAILGQAAREGGPPPPFDPMLPVLAFLKHNLSISLAFG